jgi:hypothetical protein
MELKEKLVADTPNGGFIPGQTGRLTVCRKITLTLSFFGIVGGELFTSRD